MGSFVVVVVAVILFILNASCCEYISISLHIYVIVQFDWIESGRTLKFLENVN